MKSLVVLLLLGLFGGSMCAPSQQVEEAVNTEPVEESQQVEEAVNTEPVEENESPPLGDPLAFTDGTASEYYLYPLNNQPQGLSNQQQMTYCYCPMPSTQQPANNPYMYMTYSTTPSRGMSSPQQTQGQQYMMYLLTPKY